RRHDAHDTGRFRGGQVEVRPGDRVGVAVHLGELVRPAGVPDPAVDRRVDLLCVATQLRDELVAPAFEHLGDAVQDLAAVVCGRAGPAGERLARGYHRVADVLAGGERRVGEEVAVGRRHAVGPPGLAARKGSTGGRVVG